MSTDDEISACERAKEVIRICGGFAEVARVTERSLTRVHSWTYPKEKHGTGGMIPPPCQQALMAFARERGLPLTPEHFFPPSPSQKAS